MRRNLNPEAEAVLTRCRPSVKRAAAAAVLAGAPSSYRHVTDRMRDAAARARQAAPANRPASAWPVDRDATCEVDLADLFANDEPVGFDHSAPSPAPRTFASAAPATESPVLAPEPAPPASVPAAPAAGPTFSSAGATALAAVAVPRPDPDAADPEPRHLRVVPEPGLTAAQRRRRARVVVLGSIGAGAMIALALVYFHVVLAQRQFALDKMDSQLQQAQTTYQSDRLQVAQLSSPQHIITMAEGQLGMIQPAKVTYLTPTGTSSGVRSTPGAAPLGHQSTSTVVAPAQAPAGDANWPTVKSQLAGNP
ncbi:MAG TPA: hypothetical protein VG435_11575 [Acidimicrobiales bacterium]|nr:hypothetical protein [Acidimicrobiales bacterium]